MVEAIESIKIFLKSSKTDKKISEELLGKYTRYNTEVAV